MIYNFEELFSDVTKYGKKVPKNEYCLQGKFPIIDQGKEDIAGYSNDDTGIFKNVPAIIFGDHTRILKFVTEPCLLGADGVKLLKSKKPQINDKYLFYALKNVRIPNTGYNRHFKWLKEARINIPSREEQDKIVAELENLENLIVLKERQFQKTDDLVKSRFIVYVNKKRYAIS